MTAAHASVAVNLEHSAPITRLRGIGPQLADRLARLGIHTLSDLLFHLPLRYEDRSRITPIGALRGGVPAVVDGRVELTETVFRRRRTLLVRISDGTGALILRFFYFNLAQANALARGARLRCYGEARPGAVTLEMIHPEYRLLQEGVMPPDESALTPIYPATEGIAQAKLRYLTDQALQLLETKAAPLPELLPPELLVESSMPALTEALRYVHRPPTDAPVAALMDGSHPAQQRLAFEELLAHHLSLRQLRLAADRSHALVVGGAGRLAALFRSRLPFQLTRAQQRVTAEIFRDLGEPHPMMRLLQGDVGSGKTVVAALAALQCIEAGYQVALMAPTELLAEQHYRNFHGWFASLGIAPLWLSGRLKTGKRAQAITKLQKIGRAHV